jgi:hypothetical protein
MKKLMHGNAESLKVFEELGLRLTKSEDEHHKLMQKVKAAVSTLPTRHQGKFASLTS